jgi:hypothetical protein
MRATLRRSLVPLIAAFALTRGGAALAQVAPTPPSPGSEAPAEPGIHPDAVSSFVIRAYTIAPKKLWKDLVPALEKAGYPAEVVDEKKHRVTTSFVDFKSGDYSEAVADPPPRIGAGYHILQMNEIKQGKVSIECLISKGEGGGAVLSIRARLLVEGLDQVKRIRILTDRRSSGVIESDFLRRLEDDLALERR